MITNFHFDQTNVLIFVLTDKGKRSILPVFCTIFAQFYEIIISTSAQESKYTYTNINVKIASRGIPFL